MTIADFAQKGSAFRQQFEQAGQEYRAVGTEVRKDLGDSLKKAVDASTEDILKELNLENTQATVMQYVFLRKIRWRLQKKC